MKQITTTTTTTTQNEPKNKKKDKQQENALVTDNKDNNKIKCLKDTRAISPYHHKRTKELHSPSH
jgi:hypothetical protein